jgi:hypothetical protein
VDERLRHEDTNSWPKSGYSVTDDDQVHQHTVGYLICRLIVLMSPCTADYYLRMDVYQALRLHSPCGRTGNVGYCVRRIWDTESELSMEIS